MWTSLRLPGIVLVLTVWLPDSSEVMIFRLVLLSILLLLALGQENHPETDTLASSLSGY